MVEAAQALNLPWREDASNLSFEFLRNRIRLDLIPAWEKTLGYDPVPMLARLGDLAKMDHDALSAMASESLDSLRLPDGSLSLTDLASLPEALTSRVLQQYCGQVKEGEDGSQSLSQNQVATLAGLMVSVTSGNKEKARLSLGGGVTQSCAMAGCGSKLNRMRRKTGGSPRKVRRKYEPGNAEKVC